MNLLPKNFRYAARMLFKSPGFTAVAVLALGLGIGANTAIFSLADVLLYHPLELPDLDRVVTVIALRRATASHSTACRLQISLTSRDRLAPSTIWGPGWKPT